MNNNLSCPFAWNHTFHIPVMGLAFTIDTPVKVARFGISSAVSIVDDILIERMREHYCRLSGLEYHPIAHDAEDSRAKRITDYLNLLDHIVKKQMTAMKESDFSEGSDLVKYFELQPKDTPQRKLYEKMTIASGPEKLELQSQLRSCVKVGDIDVNIMTKLDKTNYASDGEAMSSEFSDAIAALRGYANSALESSLILSAGINQRLFGFIDRFKDFFPDANGKLRKKIVLKVSDFRSALLQGRLLAKKGIWVWEYRIESGLNCGGHAFATDGILMGPILEEFKAKRNDLGNELRELCNRVLGTQGEALLPQTILPRITVQGGVGTSDEHQFLLDYFETDSVGWGSPFLLAPDVTNVDEGTRTQLAKAEKDDFYTSNSSPLGVSFNNFRLSASEQLRLQRIAKGKPGSPCRKKYLVSNTEFTEKPICTASRDYIKLKTQHMKTLDLPEDEYNKQYQKIIEKSCLCEGLAASALQNAQTAVGSLEKSTCICPGPNLAYFRRITSLTEMVQHIYGSVDLLAGVQRSNMFVNELELYVKHLRTSIATGIPSMTEKQQKHLQTFRDNLVQGVGYYRSLIANLPESLATTMHSELQQWEMEIPNIPAWSNGVLV